MKKTLSFLLALCMVFSLAACGQQASAPAPTGGSSGAASSVEEPARSEVLTFKFGSNGSGNEDDPMGYPARKFMETVEEKTNGMIQFEFYPGGQLGSEQDMLDQVVSDTLDSAMISSSVLATVWEPLYFYSMPFAFGSIDEFWDICGIQNDDLVTAMRNVVDGSGLAHFVATFHTSPRGCQNTKHEIRCADDFIGLNFRVMSGEIYTDTFRALGASTSTIAFAELFTSLQQGVIDGEDCSAFFFKDNKYYEIEKYLTEINMIQNVAPLVFSNSAWEKLTDAEKEIIYEAAALAEEESAATITRMSGQVYQELASEGVNIVRYSDLTEEGIASFREAAFSVWDNFEDRIGSELFAFLPERT